MRIPTTESRSGLDTGAGSLGSTRIVDAVGPALELLGHQISQLQERAASQQASTEAVAAQKGFLDLQENAKATYQASLEGALEGGAGFFDGLFVGTEKEPGLFDQQASAFLAGVPEPLQREYTQRVSVMRNAFEDAAARDELRMRRNHAEQVINRQVDNALQTISQNPASLDGELLDMNELVSRSGFNEDEAAALRQSMQNRMVLQAARTEMALDPDGFGASLMAFQRKG